MDPTLVINTFYAELRSAFGGNKLPFPIASKISGWSKDPYALGSYSFMAPGTSEKTYTDLGTPVLTASGVPWLVIAGEAAGSWPYPSTVHGAWAAGRKAAEVMIASKGKA